MKNNDQVQKQQIEMEKKAQAELLEEEEKKKERQRLAALYYFTAAYLDKIEQKKIIASIASMNRMSIFNAIEQPKEQKIAENCAFMVQYALVNKKFIEKKREYFEEDMEDVAFKEVRKSLRANNLKEDCFSIVAMCAAKKHIKKFCDKIMGRGLPPKEEKELADIKLKCTKIAASVLTGQKENTLKPLAEILKEGLGNACENFANAKTDDEAIEWSSLTEEILYIFDQKPELIAEANINERQFAIAGRVAELGEDVRKGMMAVEVLIASETNPKLKINEEQKKFMLDKVFTVKAQLFERQQIVKQWNEPLLTDREKPVPVLKNKKDEIPVLKKGEPEIPVLKI